MCTHSWVLRGSLGHRKGLSDSAMGIWRKKQLLLDGLTRNFFSEVTFEKNVVNLMKNSNQEQF